MCSSDLFLGPSSSDDQVLVSAVSPRWGLHLIASPVPDIQFTGWLRVCPSQVCCVPLLGSLSLAATLQVDVNCPASQEVLVSNWKPDHSLVGDAISGAKFVPF